MYSMPLMNKKSGLMKDEDNGVLMTELVGLRAKVYAVRVDGKKNTKGRKVERVTSCLNENILPLCALFEQRD